MIVAWSCSNFYIFSFLVLSSFYHYYFFTVEIEKLIGKFQQMFTTNNIISGCDGRLFPHPKVDGLFRLMDGRGHNLSTVFYDTCDTNQDTLGISMVAMQSTWSNKKNEVSLVEIEPHLDKKKFYHQWGSNLAPRIGVSAPSTTRPNVLMKYCWFLSI